MPAGYRTFLDHSRAGPAEHWPGPRRQARWVGRGLHCSRAGPRRSFLRSGQKRSSGALDAGGADPENARSSGPVAVIFFRRPAHSGTEAPRSMVVLGHFRRKREAPLTVEGCRRTLSGPSPDPSVSTALLMHRRARGECPLLPELGGTADGASADRANRLPWRVEPRLGSRVRGGAAARQTVRDISRGRPGRSSVSPGRRRLPGHLRTVAIGSGHLNTT